MSSAINCLEFQGPGRLLSQPEVNPKNVSAMTLRSQEEIEGTKPVISNDKNEGQIEKEMKEEGFIKTTIKISFNLVI